MPKNNLLKTSTFSKNEAEPLWFSNVKKYYLLFWRGKSKQTGHIHSLLKQVQTKSDFDVKYLIQFREFIEANPMILPREKKYYFFSSVTVITTRKEYKELYDLVEHLVSKHTKPLSLSSIVNTFSFVFSTTMGYLKEHPLESMSLLLAMTFALASSVEQSNLKRSDPCEEENCLINFPDAHNRPNVSSIPFDSCLTSELELEQISAKINLLGIDANRKDQSLIKEALTTVCNLEVAQILVNNKVRVSVVSEERMQKLVGIINYSACFAIYPVNKIFINEHALNNKKQLTYILANEVSHASINNNRESQFKSDKIDIYQPLLPWKKGEVLKEKMFREAYEAYLKRVKDYEKLHKRKEEAKPLSAKQKRRLNDFYKTLENYLIPIYGADQLNSLHVVLKEENNKIVEIFNEEISEPLPSKRKEYLADIFFVEHNNKAIQEKQFYLNNYGIYQIKNANEQIFADKLSDFESLSPKMRKLLGPELCAALSDFFHSDDHCRRVGWKSP